MTIAMLLRVDMKNDVKLQRKLVYLANVGHCLTWAGIVSQVSQKEVEFKWDLLNDSGLLTELEVNNLKSFPTDNKDALVSTYMLEEIGNWQHKKVGGKFPSKNDVLGIKNQV